MDVLSKRRSARLVPWLACAVAAASLHAWGCGTSAPDASSADVSGGSARSEAARVLVGLPDGGDAGGSSDASIQGDGSVPTGGACVTDTDCVAADYCASGGTCQPQKTTGQTCAVTPGGDCFQPGCRECTSTFCDDGICCGTPSCPGCESCASAQQQPLADGGTPGDGICAPVLAGTDPQSFCTPNPDPDNCMGNGLCDGKGACQTLSPVGTPCGEASCNGNSVTHAICNGSGTCVTSNLSCVPYTCELGKCATTCGSNTDCAAPATCNLGTCGATAPNGTTCNGNGDCASGFCVDGVCCDQGCTGQCEACDAEMSIGTCTAVSGAPHGARPQCVNEDDGGTCGGGCDGNNASACSYPPSTTSCGPTCSGSTYSYGFCNAGVCSPPSQSAPCNGNFVCANASYCKDSCTADTDCIAGYGCQASACVPKSAACVGNGSAVSLNDEDAGVTPCTPYACVQATGVCATTCKSNADCASGATCDTTSGQCAGGGGGGGGCSCGVAGSRGGVDGGWLVAVAAAAASGLRRRRPSVRPRRSSSVRS